MARPYLRRCHGPCRQRKPFRGGRRYRTQWGERFLCGECDRKYLKPFRDEQVKAYWDVVNRLLAPLFQGQLEIRRRSFRSP